MKEGGDKLSVYVLTHNSEKYLEQVLERLVTIADDLLIIDSGSTDKTHQIVSRFPCRFVYNAFRSFKDQRNFAQSICHHDHVLALDSDEIVSDEFVQEVIQMKQLGFDKDAYRITRFWVIRGVKVHSIFPVDSPDFPIRLFDRNLVHYGDKSSTVHESAEGYSTVGVIKGPVYHYTFESDEEIERKLHKYTKLAAADIHNNPKSSRWYFPFTAYYRLLFSPPVSWYKWYIRHRGYKDGSVGKMLGKYAFKYTQLKYKYYINEHLPKRKR